MRPIPKIRFVKETEISSAAKIEELLVRAKMGEENNPEGLEEVEKK